MSTRPDFDTISRRDFPAFFGIIPTGPIPVRIVQRDSYAAWELNHFSAFHRVRRCFGNKHRVGLRDNREEELAEPVSHGI